MQGWGSTRALTKTLLLSILGPATEDPTKPSDLWKRMLQLPTKKTFREGACACHTTVRCMWANRKESHHISFHGDFTILKSLEDWEKLFSSSKLLYVSFTYSPYVSPPNFHLCEGQREGFSQSRMANKWVGCSGKDSTERMCIFCPGDFNSFQSSWSMGQKTLGRIQNFSSELKMQCGNLSNFAGPHSHKGLTYCDALGVFIGERTLNLFAWA